MRKAIMARAEAEVEGEGSESSQFASEEILGLTSQRPISQHSLVANTPDTSMEGEAVESEDVTETPDVSFEEEEGALLQSSLT